VTKARTRYITGYPNLANPLYATKIELIKDKADKLAEENTLALRSSHQQQVSVFFALTRYMMVKITHFCSEMVLQTTKRTIVYLGLGPS
jgi:hypothetical protein